LRLPTEDDEVVAYVQTALAALDTSPRVARWRARAMGGNRTDILAESPPAVRFGLKVPVAEMRLVRDAARARDIGAETMFRRGFGTWMAAMTELDPGDLPYFLRGGLLL
jgi:hypothetical protein